MQKLLPVCGGLKAYVASPEMLVSERSRKCPFCRDKHRLRLHGHYHRHVLVPGDQAPERVPVRRLLCTRVRKTVSLLPDFCLPRRQHGPAILGTFLAGYSRARRCSRRCAQLALTPPGTRWHNRCATASWLGPDRSGRISRDFALALSSLLRQSLGGDVKLPRC
ncbi:MAG: DUF6431 domain-containing protein [Planctomycetota bacterium]